MLTIKPNTRGRSISAFTLAEMVVATGLFVFLFSALYLAMGQGMAVIQSARENLRATQIMQEASEVLRLYSWAQVNGNYVPNKFTSTFDPLATTNSRGTVYYGTITIQTAPITESYSNDIRLVTVSVNWTNKQVGHSRSLQTMVSQYGIQNYTY